MTLRWVLGPGAGAWGAVLISISTLGVGACGDDAGVGSGEGTASSSGGASTSTAGTTSNPGVTSVATESGTSTGGTSTGGTSTGGTTVAADGTSTGGTSTGGTSTGGTSTGGTTDTGGTSTGGTTGGPACGNGAIDMGEQCDGLDLQGFDCAALGLGGGTLACDPALCVFDVSMCNPVGNCGNGAIDPGEQCDGLDLQGFDCASLGLGAGVLACDPITCTFDTSMCMPMGGTSG